MKCLEVTNLEQISKESIIPFFQRSKWAVHQILPILLKKTGSDSLLHISTFGISFEALHKLYLLNKHKHFKEIHFLLDKSLLGIKLPNVLFAKEITKNIWLTDNHSKVMLLSGNDWYFTLVGSANLNYNRRHEAGFLSTQKELYLFYLESFNTICNTAFRYD